MLGILRAMAVTSRVALRRPVTRQYPTLTRRLPAHNRGLPLLVWDHEHDEPYCIGCRQCDINCPVLCITVVGPENNPVYLPPDHDQATCPEAKDGACPHHSPRKTLPEAFFIDEDRCMRCGICEEVCPTDQPRYGSQKAIVLGTGHLAVQGSVFDRNENVLDMERLTYHSRALRIELNTVMGSRPPREGLLINSPEARGMRLTGRNPFLLGLKIRLLKLYAPFWLLRRRLPLRPRRPSKREAA